MYQNAIALVQEAIPVSQSLIEENLQRVLDARGAVGIIGLVGLIWSATSVFSGLAYNINLAWEDARRRSFFEKRIVALGMIGALAVLLILSLVSEALGQLLNNFKIPIFGVLPTDDSTFWNLTSKLVPWSLILLLYFALYLWVPSIRVNWKPALWSAVISATAWKAATGGFVWYLQSGLGRYEVVYGSLGAVAALMFLIYIINFITLFGAHLNAAIQGWLNEKEQK